MFFFFKEWNSGFGGEEDGIQVQSYDKMVEFCCYVFKFGLVIQFAGVIDQDVNFVVFFINFSDVFGYCIFFCYVEVIVGCSDIFCFEFFYVFGVFIVLNIVDYYGIIILF